MSEIDIHPRLKQLGRNGWKVGVASLLLGLVMALASGGARLFFQSYLVAFLFWFGLALGSLAWLMVHHMVEGRWGFVTQRILEASSRTLPLLALLFLPYLLIGSPQLYPWWGGVESLAWHGINYHVSHKLMYLNPAFFTIRAFIYFGIWLTLTYFLNRWSKDMDTTRDPRISLKYRWVAAPGIVLYVFTMTFAMTDWGMSLEPEWFSTIYGFLFCVGQGLSSMCFTVIILSLLAEKPPLSSYAKPDRYHDLGKLMLAFTILWAYMSFAQFLITWSGNLPEEIKYYMHRTGPELKGVFTILIVFHFFVPFFILLMRGVKRVPATLRTIAFYILAVRIIDLLWVLGPAFRDNHDHIFGSAVEVPITLAVLAGIGGIWLTYFVKQLTQRPLVTAFDPRRDEAFAHDHHHETEALDHA
ncbi:MAG: hypothetical protein HZB26_05625 [Candidatus Hydrogenedentes bacterium]|nr:hypothetical protein [Candidatus Hydrogenedentota bacterium]